MKRTSSQKSGNPKTGGLQDLIDLCGSDCIDFTINDFIKFASFLSASKAFGSSCSKSLQQDAMLAFSLGAALMFEIEKQDNGEGILSNTGICTLLSKINKLIKKCCSHPDFNQVIITEKEQQRKRKSQSNLITDESKNNKLGLTKESNVKIQENIKLDLTYIANCSNVREMIPGNNNLGNRVTGISRNGRNNSVTRDNCLKAGKIWNTINSTCYCIDEKQTPHIRLNDTKIRKEYFHLGPPRSMAKIGAIKELNLDQAAKSRFEDIIAHKENINLESLAKTKCGEEKGCVWYSCLIDGIPNYFLGCKRDNAGKINNCYYNRNLLKSTTIKEEDKQQILANQKNSIERCCDKCYSSGCECVEKEYGCECTGISSNGIPCSQITAQSVSSLRTIQEGDAILKTKDFNSDQYILTNETTTVKCCGGAAECPPHMTDAECCQELCKEATIQHIISTNPSSITKVRSNNTETAKQLSGTCTCKKCGAQSKVNSAQACRWWLSQHKETCNPPDDDVRSLPETCNKQLHKHFTISDLYDFKVDKNLTNNTLDCCKGGCCTCEASDMKGGIISWPCCCSHDTTYKSCCNNKAKLKITSTANTRAGY